MKERNKILKLSETDSTVNKSTLQIHLFIYNNKSFKINYESNWNRKNITKPLRIDPLLQTIYWVIRMDLQIFT